MTSVFTTNHKNSYVAFAIAPLLLMVTACGGEDTSEKDSQALSANHKPQVSISSPAENTTLGTAATFTGSAIDDEDGALDPQIVWTSNIDGNLGSGSQLSVVLSSGSHIITASVTDSGGLEASDSISVTVAGNSSALGNLIDADTADNISPEYAATGTYVGLTVSLENPLSGITYSLDTQSQQVFSIDPQTGAVTISDGSQLEASEQAEYSLVAIATDSDGNSSSQTFSVVLENDNCPVRPGMSSNEYYSLQWDAPDENNISGYVVYLSTQDNFSEDEAFANISTSNTSIDIFSETYALVSCETLYVAVATKGDKPQSPLSEIVSVQVL